MAGEIAEAAHPINVLLTPDEYAVYGGRWAFPASEPKRMGRAVGIRGKLPIAANLRYRSHEALG
jgi:hypothetical protein